MFYQNSQVAGASKQDTILLNEKGEVTLVLHVSLLRTLLGAQVAIQNLGI